MHDIVIRHGDVVDGTGSAPARADVAIDGDRVTQVGVVSDRGESEIDATGRLVTPGFVDIHTHLDAQLFWDPVARFLRRPGLRRHLDDGFAAAENPGLLTDRSQSDAKMAPIAAMPTWPSCQPPCGSDAGCSTRIAG